MTQGLPTLDDLDVHSQCVFVRVDFNAPIRHGKVEDDTRIRAHLPTLKALMDRQAKIILASHLGRPEGKGFEDEYSLEPVAQRLQELLGTKMEVVFSEDCLNDSNRTIAQGLKKNQVLLLENLRFYKEETKNDKTFCARLAAMAHLYVNDAFGTCHRAHASTEGMAKLFSKGKKAAGLLLEKEIKVLSPVLENPVRPLMALLGGAKVSDKIKVIESFLQRADVIAIGGAMAYTFLRAQEIDVGSSLIEKDFLTTATSLLKTAKEKNKKFLLPVDHVVGKNLEDSQGQITDKIPSGKMGLDIGPKTLELFKNEIKKVQCIVWNGPMGVFENEGFAKGTIEIAKFIGAETENRGLKSIAGGGDSLAAISQAKVEEKFFHLSTGGGASLEFLEGKILPGIAALTESR